MEDRELLELAAKAAGIVMRADLDGCGHGQPMIEDDVPGVARMVRRWNPLNSNHDALDLAVRLGIDILPGRGTEAWTRAIGQTVFADEPPSVDRSAATRRAIVRAAAAIGKEG
jgi:hypothetical protein